MSAFVCPGCRRIVTLATDPGAGFQIRCPDSGEHMLLQSSAPSPLNVASLPNSQTFPPASVPIVPGVQ